MWWAMSNKSKKHGSGLGCDVHRYIMTSIMGQTPDSLGWWEGTLNDFCYQIQANQRHTRASSPHTKPGFVCLTSRVVFVMQHVSGL